MKLNQNDLKYFKFLGWNSKQFEKQFFKDNFYGLGLFFDNKLKGFVIGDIINIDNIIELNELSFLINNRTKNIVIKNNNKKKNMMNFVKNVIGGLIVYIENNDKYILEKENYNIYVKLKNPNSEINLCDWIFVDDESY